MRTYSSSAELPGPQGAAWHILSNVRAWPTWVPTVEDVQVLDTGDLAIGSRFRITQAKLQPTVWQVTELHAPTDFAWLSRSPGVQIVATHNLTSLDSSRCRLDLRITFTGWLSPLTDALFGRLTKRYIDQEAEALGRRLSVRDRRLG